MVSAARPSEHPDWLTDEHLMLLRIRDTLYEGSWSDFVHDLEARAADRPHVFDLVPPSAEARSLIENHLQLIHNMQQWEKKEGLRLCADQSHQA